MYSLLLINRSPRRSINFISSNNCFTKARKTFIKDKKDKKDKKKNLTSLNETICIEKISIDTMKRNIRKCLRKKINNDK